MQCFYRSFCNMRSNLLLWRFELNIEKIRTISYEKITFSCAIYGFCELLSRRVRSIFQQFESSEAL